MTPARFKFPLRTWLLVALLPVLGLLVFGYALITYRGLYSIILEGFDRKLIAVSTVTAAFINPNDHAMLVDPLPVAGLAPDAMDGGLWSSSRLTGEFLRIDSSSGQADATGLWTEGLHNHTAAGDGPGLVFVVDGETGVVRRVSIDTGESSFAFNLEPPIHAITTDPARKQLFVAGREFKRIELVGGKETLFRPLPFIPRGMAYDAKRNALWIIDAQGDELLEIAANDGSVLKRIALRFDPESDSTFTHPRLPVDLRAIAVDPFGPRLLGVASSLFAIDPETGIVSTPGFVSAFGREQGSIYRSYVPFLRSLQNRVGTKFLYTQQVHNLSVITYGLDASLGDDHSPLLAVDELPPAAIEPVQKLLTDGTLYVSGIQQWEQWGLLKTAFAPIFDPDSGQVAAIAGADIDISTIQFDTHQALVVTIGAGLVLMIAAGLLSLVIARQLTGPLNVIRAGALRAAAGDYTQRVQIARPRELSDLATRFSTSSATLHELVRSLSQAIASRRAERDQIALRHRLGTVATDNPEGSVWTWGTGTAVGSTVSGALQHNGATLAWLTTSPADEDSRNLRRAVLAVTARALLSQHGCDEAALAHSLAASAGEGVAWFLLTPTGPRPLGSFTAGPGRIESSHDGLWTVISQPPLPPVAAWPDGGSPAQFMAVLLRTAPEGTFLCVFKRP